jgi:hypothetical protein
VVSFTRLKRVRWVIKRFIPFIVLTVLALQACSRVPAKPTPFRVTEAPEQLTRDRYTDEEIELWIQQFPFLTTGNYGTSSPENALEQLGIDTDELELVDRWIGDCYDGSAYDLSPSYLLLVDRNACFGLRVWIEAKDDSG